MDMDQRAIYIYHRNRNYLLALTARLSALLQTDALRPAGRDDLESLSDEEVYMVQNYSAASDVAADISGRFDLDCTISTDSCVLNAFTSGAGGVGTTSAALCYGRVLSQLYDLRTLYISLDVLASKCRASLKGGRERIYELLFEADSNIRIQDCYEKDSSGLCHIVTDTFVNPCSLLGSTELSRIISRLCRYFDRIVMDVPVSAAESFEALDLCENVIVCFGWDVSRFASSQALYDYLESGRSGVRRFTPLYCDSDDMGVYGQFGAEVRELAQSIEGQ